MIRIAAAMVIAAVLAQRGMAQPPSRVQIGMHGAVSATHADRVAGGKRASEVRLEQTMLMGSVALFSGHLTLISTISIDRVFSDDGVLTLGAWGGGFYDRQHPHEYLTEAVASLIDEVGTSATGPRISFSAGRGVVPFGPDLPMDRPSFRSTANHHWSHIMDRWFGSFAVRGDRLALELAMFDGDGPSPAIGGAGGHAGHGPCPTCATNMSTTSGSARVTAWPTSWLELRLSGAVLRSSGHHAGAGGEHRMLNVTTAFARTLGVGRATALFELGRVSGDQTYPARLGELQLSRSRYRVYYRAEQSDRAEGARADRFLSAPEIRENAVGTTRWLVQTVGVAAPTRIRGIAFEPVAELGTARVRSVGSVPIDVVALYRARTLWSGVIALRTRIGTHRRMGLYGAMAGGSAHAAGHLH